MIARKEGRIFDDLHLKSLIDVRFFVCFFWLCSFCFAVARALSPLFLILIKSMLEYRNSCGTIWSYDWISVSLRSDRTLVSGVNNICKRF